MLILDLLGISFHAAEIFGLGKNLSFKSVLGHCVRKFILQQDMFLYAESFQTNFDYKIGYGT